MWLVFPRIGFAKCIDNNNNLYFGKTSGGRKYYSSSYLNRNEPSKESLLDMESERKKIKVLMFPWLAHGHVSPFLELAIRLANKNFDIQICSTPISLSHIKNKIPEELSIQLVELHLPSLPHLPAHHHTTNGLPLNLQPTLRKALKMAKPDFSSLLKTLQPDLVIYDIIISWVGAVSIKHNIPTVVFFTTGAAMFSYFAHMGTNPGIEYPFPEIRLTDFELAMACKTMETAQGELNEEKDSDDEDAQNESGFILVHSCKEIEGKYMEYLSKLINKEIVPVGVWVQNPSIHIHDSDSDFEIMDWLGRKEGFSTVFVSFGSEYSLDLEEMAEVAHALELSKANFIWIIRFATGKEMKIEEALPKGFLERVGEKGKIVEKWAPQAKILTHPSIGGFVSHCGWNSVSESIEYGVPVIAMPTRVDQPMNAKLMVLLGVGVGLKRDVQGKILRGEIAEGIHDVIFEKTGAILRQRIVELREKIRSTSKDEMEVVAKKLAIVSGNIRLSEI